MSESQCRGILSLPSAAALQPAHNHGQVILAHASPRNRLCTCGYLTVEEGT